MNAELDQLMDILAEWAAGAPVTVYVFGSRVRGDYRPDSDVDLYVAPVKDNWVASEEWFAGQENSDFPELRKRLPWPLKVMPPGGAAYPLVLPGAREVARKGNVVAMHTPPKPKRKGPPN
jgi:hypothetical protein